MYVYVPTPNVVRAPNTPTAPIVINENNVIFTPAIPKKLQDLGLEPLMEYFQSHPLRYALSNVATPFLPRHVNEFNYSCVFNTETQTLQGTIADGDHVISITPTTVRNALCLPILSAYLDNPTDAECKAILPSIDYDVALQGVRNGT